jgi:Reverse transcriptase (RNA-dependent DNA polymerase)
MRQWKNTRWEGIGAEHLKQWMVEAKESNDLENREIWRRVVQLVQMASTDLPLPKSFGIGIRVLIPNGAPDQYRGIALLEVIYKLVSLIINKRISWNVQYHDAVLGFQQWCRTITAIIAAKVCMQIAKRTTKPLYFVFMDLKKAFDRECTIQILK